MIRYLPFEVGHVGFLEPDVAYIDLTQFFCEQLQNPKVDLVTVVRKQTILCIAGCTEVRPGTGEVWLIIDRRMHHYKKGFVRAVKRLITEYLGEECGYHRLQMCTDVNYPERARFAEHLGFTHEGVMKSFHEKADHHLYARIL